MKLSRRKVLTTMILATASMVVAIPALGMYLLWASSLVDEKSAIQSTLKWGRLAPIPASASQIKVTSTGNPFTRGFRLMFKAPAKDLEHWLEESDGTRESMPTFPLPQIRHYEIKPDGAQHAEVEVDDAQNRVNVYVYWS